MKKETKKGKIGVLFLTALLMILFMVPVEAKENLADIKICYRGEENDKGMFLNDMPVKVYLVGSSGVGGILADDFKESGLSLEDLESLPTSELQKVAVKTADYADKNKISGIIKKTNEKGEVKFQELAYGLYLVVPQNRYEIETGSFLLSPFFVNLPLDEEETQHYPKAEWEEKKPETTANFESAKTGDAGFDSMVIVLAIISGCMCFLCLLKRNRT